MDALTDRQQAILDFIAARVRDEGLPPSGAEIAAHFGIYPSAARKHLLALEARGALRRLPGRARGIRLDADAQPRRVPRSLPVVGRVAAGAPIGTLVEVEEELPIDPALFPGHPDCLLRVHGDSMRDEGILDGDLVAIHRCRDAADGAIVVARIDDEITIKRLQRMADGVRLLPRNPAYAPIEVPPDAAFAIEGLYCGLVRRD